MLKFRALTGESSEFAQPIAQPRPHRPSGNEVGLEDCPGPAVIDEIVGPQSGDPTLGEPHPRRREFAQPRSQTQWKVGLKDCPGPAVIDEIVGLQSGDPTLGEPHPRRRCACARWSICAGLPVAERTSQLAGLDLGFISTDDQLTERVTLQALRLFHCESSTCPGPGIK